MSYLWIYTSIAGALLGAACLAYIRDTRIGLWGYKQFDKGVDWLRDRYGLTWFDQPKDAWKKVSPKIAIKIEELDLIQSEKDLAISESDLKPTASLSLERSYSEDLSSTYDQREKDTLKATISWPFYSGGKKRSKINKNSNLTYRKRLLLEDTIKTNDTNVASAWSSLDSSKSFLNSVIAQVRAAKIANE